MVRSEEVRKSSKDSSQSKMSESSSRAVAKTHQEPSKRASMMKMLTMPNEWNKEAAGDETDKPWRWTTPNGRRGRKKEKTRGEGGPSDQTGTSRQLPARPAGKPSPAQPAPHPPAKKKSHRNGSGAGDEIRRNGAEKCTADCTSAGA